MGSNNSVSAAGAPSVKTFWNQQASQVTSIRSGLVDGSLSQREAAQLLKSQSAVAGKVAEFNKDGFISAGEGRQLNALLKGQREQISELRSNTEKGRHGSVAPEESKRQFDQLTSIATGLGSSLTSTEVAPLLKEQAGVASLLSRYTRDGSLNSLEAHAVDEVQDHASGSIGLARLLITDDKGRERFPDGYGVGVTR